MPFEPSYTMPPDERPASPTAPMATSGSLPRARELPADFRERLLRFTERMAPFAPSRWRAPRSSGCTTSTAPTPAG
jgi:hypothetical protein